MGSPRSGQAATASERAVLGIDVGGTDIKARLLAGDGAVLEDRRVPTPRGDDRGADTIAAVGALVRAAQASIGGAVAAVGVVVPGVVDEEAGIVRLAVNLGWKDLPLRQLLADARLGVPVAFGQDVRAGALAEAQRDDLDPDAGPVAFVPIGTGVASALLIAGRPLTAAGWAGEIGQQRIPHGPHAGLRVEEIASAAAVTRLSGAPSAEAAAERVRAGDPHAAAVWNDCVEVLADSLAGMTAVTGCATIIVGGGLARSGALLLDPLTAALSARLEGLRMPTLLPARHGAYAGALGAALLAREISSTTGKGTWAASS